MKINMKKIFSTIIIFVMAFALIMPAGATGPANNPDIPVDITEGSIEISKPGSEFSVYKVLDATYKEGQKKVYSYSATRNFEHFFGNEKYIYEYEDENNNPVNEVYSIDTISKVPSEAGTKEDPITPKSSNFTDDLQSYIRAGKVAPTFVLTCDNVEDAVAKAENLGLGFYLIVETATHSDSATVASKSMLVPIPVIDGDKWNFELEVKPKDEPVTVDKSILIAKGEEFDKVNTSTNNVGDILDYQVDATIPHYDANVLNHPDYPNNIKYWITDTLSKGLSFKDSVTITASDLSSKPPTELIKDVDYTIDYSTTLEGRETNDTMIIKFNYDKIKEYHNLQLKYNVVINENAIIGVEGNPNEVTLEYTNNPTTGNTSKPWDETISYTYGLKINKVDAENEDIKLAGAEFKLLKGENADGEVVATYKFDANGKLTLNGHTIDEQGNPIIPTGSPAITDEKGVAYLIGIKAGTYTLKETKAPDGYILPDGEMKLLITEDTDEEGNRTVTYKLDNTILPVETINSETVADGSYAVTAITNPKGFNLPRTGGAGTWMFTVGGILIMASMVAVFVKLRKKEN